MLQELIVENFAIIRRLAVSFQPGLNMLTGETGAGKSILVGAVNLILGSRAMQEMIRTGASEATVEGVFSLSGWDRLSRLMGEWGLDASEELVIRRVINRSGRNRVYLNEQQISLQQLQQLSKGLISISGQHEHQLLLDPDVHLSLLDAYGETEGECGEVRAIYDEWLTTRDELHKLRRFKQDEAAKIDWMRFQLHELESAQLQPDEDTELEQERNILRHAATLAEAARDAHQSIYAGKGAILEQMSTVEKRLETLHGIDPSLHPLVQQCEEARIHLEELAHSLHQYANRIEFDPRRLAAIEERLALIQRLGKKYGATVQDMLRRLGELRESLAMGESVDAREEELSRLLESHSRAYLDKAEALSGRRREAAVSLSREVEKALGRLDMPRARFEVQFPRDGGKGDAKEPVFAPTGIDQVEFLLTANPGEDFKPLARVASGGELSRILLALKSLVSRKDEAETLVFDEVDAGIGGRTAELVGLQLKRLAAKHQVICITHLPQIASYGQTHYRVIKDAEEEETRTRISLLSDQERVEELARMLGGITISEKALEHAAELLNHALKQWRG